MIAPGCLSNDRPSMDSATRPITRFSNSARFHCNSPLRVGAMCLPGRVGQGPMGMPQAQGGLSAIRSYSVPRALLFRGGWTADGLGSVTCCVSSEAGGYAQSFTVDLPPGGHVRSPCHDVRSLSDIDRSTAANDPKPSASFSARKNPHCIPANTPPVFSGLRPCIWLRLLRLVTNGSVGQAPSATSRVGGASYTKGDMR
jgi:hypothetical protein